MGQVLFQNSNKKVIDHEISFNTSWVGTAFDFSFANQQLEQVETLFCLSYQSFSQNFPKGMNVENKLLLVIVYGVGNYFMVCT